MCMRLILFAALIALLPAVAACGFSDEPPPPAPTSTPLATPTPRPTATPLPTPSPTPAPTPSPTETPIPANIAGVGTGAKAGVGASTGGEEADAATAATIINTAIDAMRRMRSFHAEVDAAFTVIQTEASFRMDEQTFGTKFPIRFSGDFLLPDRAAGKLQASLGIVALELDIITIGEQAYITNPETGAWEQYPLAFTGLPDPYDLVLPPSDAARYSDLEVVKDASIDGVKTRHIRANLRASMLGGSYENLFVEMWIGKDDDLIYRMSMAGETEVGEQDTAGLASRALGAADIGGNAEFNMTVTYSDFDAPVVIEPPIP